MMSRLRFELRTDTATNLAIDIYGHGYERPDPWIKKLDFTRGILLGAKMEEGKERRRRREVHSQHED